MRQAFGQFVYCVLISIIGLVIKILNLSHSSLFISQLLIESPLLWKHDKLKIYKKATYTLGL